MAWSCQVTCKRGLWPILGMRKLLTASSSSPLGMFACKKVSNLMCCASRNPQLQHMKNIQQQQMMHTSMQRDGSGMDMGGQRPQSPADSAPSPKRQRLDGNAFNGQGMGPAGRGQPPNMQGQQVGNPSGPGANQNQLLLQNGINPNQLPPNQFDAFQGSTPHLQGKAVEVGRKI